MDGPSVLARRGILLFSPQCSTPSVDLTLRTVWFVRWQQGDELIQKKDGTNSRIIVCSRVGNKALPNEIDHFGLCNIPESSAPIVEQTLILFAYELNRPD
jgi:hypothetical protein